MEKSISYSTSSKIPEVGSERHPLTVETPPTPSSASNPVPVVVPPPTNMPTGPNILYERPPGMKARVYRSAVWEHFTTYWVRNVRKVKNPESGLIEDVCEYKERAKCKYCPKGQGDFAAESGPNGTGGPNKHIPKKSIRNAVKFVRSSPSRLALFKKAVVREKIDYKGLVCLDVPTRWNSTYLMLDSTLKLKRAFKRMEQDVDSPYLAYFNEPDEEFDDDGNAIVQRRDKKKIGPPRDSDWDACEQFISFLAVFYEVTLRVSASNHPTIHTTFHDIVHMEEVLISRSICAPQTATQKLMADIASLMKTKYNKYFGQLKDLNPFIFVGIVMDPRFKMKHVTKLLSVELMWSDYEVEKKEKEIKALLFELFEEYSAKNDKSLKKRSVEPVTSSSNSSTLKRHKIKENDSHIGSRVNLATSNLKYVVDWTKHVTETDEATLEHEIDTYLKDPLLAIKDQKGDDIAAEELIEKYNSFDILQWWKNADSRYPVLSSLAKDIFAIQVSTVASESAFSTGGRVIDSFRSSLTPKSVEALICM
ncbi:Unknown protein [Striga hermonthica]|uniref:Transposase n=1 Tax=Striga hermonthica TaxID=68872 RepID=A0A9N7RJH8_STRHE|nr:Unknown protein [Striga hermonthica]